jgi:hypothetical protein
VRSFVDACWFAFKWGLLAALVCAVGIGLYYYSRLNDEIRRRVEAKFASCYPNLHVVVRSAQLVDGQGIEIRGVLISDPKLTGPAAELAYFDEIMLTCNTNLQELVQHDPKFTAIQIRRPRIQATRLPDGSWSASQLLPLPKLSEKPAPMQIDAGQLFVYDPQRNPAVGYDIHNINMTMIPQQADAAPGADQICDLEGSLAGDHVQRVEFKGQASRTSGAFVLEGAVSGIDISPELANVLPPEYAERAKPLAPLRGQANLNFRVRRNPADPTPLQFELAGAISSGGFFDPRLPEALPELHANFSANNAGFRIDHLTSKNGPTELDWNVQVGGYQAGSPILVTGKAVHLRIGKNWENILPEKALVQWRKFLPEGEINVDEAKAEFDGERWRLSGTVECLNTSFEYYRFPYRLEGGRGELKMAYDEARQQNVLSLSVQAFSGNRPVNVEGTFYDPGPNFTGGVTISCEALPFDQKVYHAISATQAKTCEVLQSLNPVGSFNIWVKTERHDPTQQVMNQDVQIDLNRCSFNYEKFPYPIHGITGTLRAVDGQWTFQNLEGTNHNGRIHCNGSLTPVDGGVALLLNFAGENIPLDDELRDALPVRMQPLWNNLKPRGFCNLLDAEVRYTSADKQLSVTTRAEPAADTVSIDPNCFPYRLEKMHGILVFHDDKADFMNMRAFHDRTEVTANGSCQRLADGGWNLHFDSLTADPLWADRDRDLLIALPPKLRKVVTQLNPTGLISMRGGLDLWGKPVAQPADVAASAATPPANATCPECIVRSQWSNLEFDIENGTLHTGVDLKDIHGKVTLNGDYDPEREDGQRLRSQAIVDVDSLTWNTFQFTKIQGPMWLDDRQVIFGANAEQRQAGRQPHRLAAGFYGGAIEADGRVLLEDAPRFAIQAAVDNVELNRFCTDALPGRQKLKGRVQGGVNFTGNASGLHTLAGNGQVRLRDADIYELPVMLSLLKLLNLRRPDATAFTTSDVQFRLEGEHIVLENIEFCGDAISLVGEGEMSLNTDINLHLQPILGRSDMQLPVWKKLMGGASEQIMQVQVTGTLADPHATRQAFPMFNQALQSIQAGMQPGDKTVPVQGLRAQPASAKSGPR